MRVQVAGQWPRWSGPGPRSTSSPTTCRSWWTRCDGAAPARPGRCTTSSTRSCVVRPGTSAGALHGCSGLPDGSPRPTTRSKSRGSHLEIDTLAGPGEAAELAADLRAGARPTSGSRSRTTRRCATGPLSLADSLALAAPPAEDDAESPGEIAALLRWLADGHFTFLGYREYDLVDGADGMPLPRGARHRAGHPAARPAASSAFAALPPEVRAKATRAAAADPDQGQLDGHRAPAALPGLRRGQAVRAGRRGDRRVAVPRAVHALGVLREHHPDPGAAPQAGRGAGATGLAADSHDGNDLAEFLENYPREELFQVPVADLIPIAHGVLRLRDRKQTRLFLRKDPYGRYMSCLVYMPRDRYTTAIRLRAQEILRQALGGESVSYSAMVGESAVSRLHVVVRAGRGKTLPDADEAALERQLVGGHPVLGRRPGRGDPPGDGRGRGPVACSRCATTRSRTPTRPTCPPRPRPATWPGSPRCGESGENTAFELWESEGFVGGVPATVEPDTGEPSTGPAATEQHAPRVWRLTIYRTQAPPIPHRRAAPAPAHGRRRGRRAPVRVRRERRQVAVLDL